MDETLGSSTGPAATPALLTLFAQNGAEALSGAASASLVAVLVAALFMLVGSALASMTEAAFLSLSMARAHTMVESDHRMDRIAGKMRLDFAKPLATIVVVNNIANIAGSGLTGMFFKEWVEQTYSESAAVASGVFFSLLTLVVILWGEIVPKTIGERNNVVICRVTAPAIRFLQTILTPVIWLVGLTQRPFLRVGSRHVTSEEEIARLTDLGAEQGAIEEDEGEMIQRVFRLNDLTAEDVMTPRVEMVTFQADQTLRDIADELGEANRSRIPLYRESRDEIVAILDRSEALLALAEDHHDLKLTNPAFSFKPFFVPETMPADDIMVALQRRTQPMAIVVGEYGETVGLVTLEDVIEEIVGEIVDEEDLENAGDLQRIADDEVLCDARIEVNEVNEALETQIPNHRTLAGLLLDEMERIPRRGETLEAFGALFTVVHASEKAILQVRVQRLPTEAELEEAEQAGDAAA
jgi:CBS domain containing-hemolysin-like protein